MTASLFTLNFCKTEFLLIGLKKQCAKIYTNFSLSTIQSARNLSFVFDEHLTFSDQTSSLSKSSYHHICQTRCIRPYTLSPQNLVSFPLPSLSPYLIIVDLFTTASLSLK